MINNRQNKEYQVIELAKEYIQQGVRDEYIKKIEHAENYINEDLKEAITAEGLTFNVNLVSTLRQSPDAINKIITKHKESYLKAQTFLPNKEKQRIESNYNEVTERLAPKNNSLFYKLEPFKYELTETKDKRIIFDKEAVNSHVLTLGIRTLNEKETEYINLLQNIAELLTKAHNIEVEQDYIPYTFGIDTVYEGILYQQGFIPDLKSDTNFVEKLTNRSTLKYPIV